MEFWGVEVKPGHTVTCDPGTDRYLHLSQASLGESKKGNTSVPIYVNVDDKKLGLGTLSHDKCAQIQYDLVFEKEFKLFHGGKDASVFFLGYMTLITEDMPGGYSDTESEEEPSPIQKANGKSATKEESKPAPKANLQKQLKEAEEAAKAKEDKSDDESDDESDEEESGDEDDSDEEMDDESDDEEDESSEEEEEKITPKKPESGKKRQLDSDSKVSVSDKKAKFVTPAKTEGKKAGGHVPTPYPSKQSAKTQANEGKKQQTPKSGGAFSCKSCSKTFGSESAVLSHTKAKHSGQ